MSNVIFNKEKLVYLSKIEEYRFQYMDKEGVVRLSIYFDEATGNDEYNYEIDEEISDVFSEEEKDEILDEFSEKF